MNWGAGESLRVSDSNRVVSKATANGALSRFDSSGHLPRFSLGSGDLDRCYVYITYGSPA